MGNTAIPLSASVTIREPFHEAVHRICPDQLSTWEKSLKKCEEVATRLGRTPLDEGSVDRMFQEVQEALEHVQQIHAIATEELKNLSSEEMPQRNLKITLAKVAAKVLIAVGTAIFGADNNDPKESYVAAAIGCNSAGIIIGLGCMAIDYRNAKKNDQTAGQIKALNSKRERVWQLIQDTTNAMRFETFLSELKKISVREPERKIHKDLSVSSLDTLQIDRIVDRCLLRFGDLSKIYQGDDERYSKLISLLVQRLPPDDPLYQHLKKSIPTSPKTDDEIKTPPLPPEWHGEASPNPRFSIAQSSSLFDASEHQNPLEWFNKMLKERFGLQRDLQFIEIEGQRYSFDGSVTRVLSITQEPPT